MIIPKVKLGDFVDVGKDNEYEPIKHGLTKYVAGEHLESEILHITRFGDIESAKDIIGSAFHRKFSKGDVLFGTRRAYLRKTGIATFDGICSNTTLVLKSKQNGLVDGLLPFIVRLEKFTEHAVKRSVGSTNPYIRWRDLADFEFELPGKKEQLQIKEFLWSIQNSIDKLENVIQKTQMYYNSRRESLLTRGIGHSKFKKAKWLFGKEIEIPEEWELISMKKTNVSVIDGDRGNEYPQENEFLESGYCLFLSAKNVTNKGFLFNDCSFISKERDEKLRKGRLSRGDIIITTRGTIGNIAYFDESISFDVIRINSGMVIIRNSNELISQKFLYQLLKSSIMIKQFKRSMYGSAQSQLTIGIIDSLKLIIPSLEEQQKIISILSNINNQIIQFKNHLLTLKTMQNSILNLKLKVKEKVIDQ